MALKLRESANMRRFFLNTVRWIAILAGLWMLTSPALAQRLCSDLINPVFPAAVPQNKSFFLSRLQQAIDSREKDIRKILSAINTVQGTDLELELVRKQLREEVQIELYNLQKTPDLENIAVYAATNVPLYTLISHGMMSKVLAKNVWFRTPEATRNVYVELYEILRQELSDSFLRGFHLLKETRDVQYDNFNKMYVLGLNKRGTRSERSPAEIVIFTGNPDTAQRLLEYNSEKIKAAGEQLQLPAFQQVFLGFGAGINPIVITSSAKKNIKAAVDIVLEPTRINNGQDCMAADMIAIHKDVEPEFMKALQSRIKLLKVGELSDPHAAVTPLRMNRNFAELKAFREKYKKYLRNPEALIDETTQVVSPHIFVLPFSEFAKYELKEHFAPFFVFFTYKSQSELENIALDERVQQKAMYAAILGDTKASNDLTQAVQLFRENRHSVIVNQSLFGDVHPSMPFGGRGSKSSMLVRFAYDPKSGLQILQNHRAALLSTEAFNTFGENKISVEAPSRSQAQHAKNLNSLIAEATSRNPKGLLQPPQNPRPTGLQHLREVARTGGLRLLLGNEDPSTNKKEQLSYLWGLPVVSAPLKPREAPTQFSGVLLHPSDVGEEITNFNRARGELNPHMPYRDLLIPFAYSKLNEYTLVRAVDPKMMGTAEIYQDLIQSRRLPVEIESKREKIAQKINLAMKAKDLTQLAPQSALARDLFQYMEELFTHIRHLFPQGVYFKNYGEYGTADMGTQITSFSTPPRQVAEEFLRRVSWVVTQRPGRTQQLGDLEVIPLMEHANWEMGTRFVFQLLKNPDQLMFQYRMKIAKTQMGHPKEFRVDFIDGEAVHSRPRFSPEYLLPESQEAARAFNEFFKKVPHELRTLSGGADVAKLEDGSWTIIEFNFGPYSGTFTPHYFTFDYHQMISFIAGQPTQWLSEMQNVAKGGFESRAQYLQKLKYVRPLFEKKEPFEELSVYEVVRFFRDLDFEAFFKNPNREKAQDLREEYRKLLTPYMNNESIRILWQTIDNKLPR